jgi:protein ImuB
MLCCLLRDRAAESARPGVLLEIARACSPRVEAHGDRAVLFDAAGLDRVIGPPRAVADEIQILAGQQGLIVRVALAPTAVTAWLLAHARPGITVVEASQAAAALAGLPLDLLARLPDATLVRRPADPLALLARWGLRTLGDVARLPRADVRARLGAEGVRLHQAACGEDAVPLTPAGEAPRFLERMVLEWPIEGLQPLTFVLARLCDALALSLERADRGAVTLVTTLRLVTRETHARTLHLPAPMRDPRVLRTLIALDLESHPPAAGIDIVTIEAEVTPGRIVQGSLLARALPAPEAIATLTARLSALVGESRVGAPALVDTHDARAAAMAPFRVTDLARASSADAAPAAPHVAALPATVVRRFRLPVAIAVDVERGRPVRVGSAPGVPAGAVVHSAGPWRSSGRWWALDRTGWDRDEWDVELVDGRCYRIARDRATGRWELDGEID